MQLQVDLLSAKVKHLTRGMSVCSVPATHPFLDLEEADARADMLNADKTDLEARIRKLSEDKQAMTRQCTGLHHTMAERERELARLRKELDHMTEEFQHSSSMKRALEDRVRIGSPTKVFGDSRYGLGLSTSGATPLATPMRF
jgi:uncharacterized coiled-coil protein SlyX